MMNYLRGGKILKVNLTDGTISTEPVGTYAERFIGGKGIDTKLLFDGVNPDTQPFDAENILLFGAGTLVGTPFPGACRLDIMAKSPVTKALGYASMGGYFSGKLKTAGYDNLVITGRAEKPVYLYINNDNIEIKDASHIWGHDTYETPEIIRREIHDLGAEIISVGPAGERMVVYASIMSPTGNTAARTGMGAVMGSKNLKALAVNGTGGIAVAKPQEFLAACQKMRESISKAQNYEELHAWGLTRLHDTEMRNWYEVLGNVWSGGEVISEEKFVREYRHQKIGCLACPVACFQGCEVPGIGAGCMKCSPPGDLTWDVKNPEMSVFWKTFIMCQKSGLDARALGNVLVWLMRLYEQGVITEADTDGVAMEWGSLQAISAMTRKIIYREGFGDLLAEGLTSAAKKIGKGAENYLFVMKGSPSDMHVVPIKSRVLRGAVSPIGGDSSVQPPLDWAATRAYVGAKNEDEFQEAIREFKDTAEMQIGLREAPDPRTTTGKAALIHQKEMVSGACNIAGVCAWLTAFMRLTIDTQDIANALTLGLGISVTVDTLTQAVLRLQHVERAFGARLGLTRDNDVVSKGYYNQIQLNAKARRELGFNDEELERMKDDYYALKGWDTKTGVPTRAILEKFDIGDVADKLGL